jgi:multidrug resistance efflux pump
MEAAVEKMEAQLKLWGLQIHKLAAKTQKAGARARFEDLMYIDELKALHAIAQSRFDEFRGAGDTERARLRAEMSSAWDELDADFNNPKP